MLTFELPPLSWVVLAEVGTIFILRVIGVTLSTVRMLVMMRNRKILSASIGFFEVLVYVLAIGVVVNNLSNVWNVLSYCVGFIAGTLIGMTLEEKLVMAFATVNVISREKGSEVAQAIRDAGFGATVSWGTGREGMVELVTAIVRRSEVGPIQSVIEWVDPDAFISVQEARSIRRGYRRMAQPE